MQTKAYGSFFTGNEPEFVLARDLATAAIIEIV